MTHQIEFRICPSLFKKPLTVGASLEPPFNASPKWGPGSDMHLPDERMILAKLNGTHDLALNLFCVDKPQLILLTQDSYQRQHQALDCDDFSAALEVLCQLKNMYIVYNCTEVAGCSRMHKHMQGLRGPPKAFNLFVQQAENVACKVPFQYFAHRFNQGFQITSASDILAVYDRLLSSSRRALGLSEAGGACPHNVVLWMDTLIVIPRRRASLEQTSANASGMLGSIWVSERSFMENWKRLGAQCVLKEFGVPYAEPLV